jgi:hypothetical protein
MASRSSAVLGRLNVFAANPSRATREIKPSKTFTVHVFHELFTVPTQSAQPAPVGPTTPMVSGSALSSVPMRMEGGIYVVPVLINDAITLNFVVDSGAADVSIPADVVMTLMRTGTLKEADFLREKTYVLADGSKVPSQSISYQVTKGWQQSP